MTSRYVACTQAGRQTRYCLAFEPWNTNLNFDNNTLLRWQAGSCRQAWGQAHQCGLAIALLCSQTGSFWQAWRQAHRCNPNNNTPVHLQAGSCWPAWRQAQRCSLTIALLCACRATAAGEPGGRHSGAEEVGDAAVGGGSSRGRQDDAPRALLRARRQGHTALPAPGDSCPAGHNITSSGYHMLPRTVDGMT